MLTNNKLREAVQALVSEIGCYSSDSLEVVWCGISGETIKKAHAALSDPPRNCEMFSTVDEALKAWDDYLEKHPELPPSCKTSGAIIPWLFAPATETEGGNDAVNG